MPSSSGHRKSPPPLPPPASNWAELPRDVLRTIFLRLGPRDILTGPALVCGAWRRLAAEPAFWRRVDLDDLRGAGPADFRGWRAMVRAAVDLGGRDCVSYRGRADDELLLYVAERAPSMKSLSLISCYDISNEGFTEAIKKFPLLEELDLSNVGLEAFKVDGKACPRLKHFPLSRLFFYRFDYGYDYDFQNNEEVLGIATMHELRSLQLFGNNLTNKGLTTILENCPHMESLYLDYCFNVDIDAVLESKFARIRILSHPHDSTDEYARPFINRVICIDDSDVEDLGYHFYGCYMDSEG